jgi:hypothetical protein
MGLQHCIRSIQRTRLNVHPQLGLHYETQAFHPASAVSAPSRVLAMAENNEGALSCTLEDPQSLQAFRFSWADRTHTTIGR